MGVFFLGACFPRNSWNITTLLKHYYSGTSIQGIACEQALHWGEIVKSWRMRGMWEEIRKQGAWERKESLQRSLPNFHFHTEKKPGHCKARKLSLQTCFFFIDWTWNVNMSTRITTQHFDSRFVYIWKVVHIQKTKLPMVTPTRLLSRFTRQLLPTLSVFLLDGQLLILRQLCCHVHISEFSTQWNSIRQKDVHWKAVL